MLARPWTESKPRPFYPWIPGRRYFHPAADLNGRWGIRNLKQDGENYMIMITGFMGYNLYTEKDGALDDRH